MTLPQVCSHTLKHEVTLLDTRIGTVASRQLMFFFYLSLVACLACAGCSWTKVSTTGPSARSGHVMAFDGVNQQTMLFGGAVKGTYFNDTWEWNGQSWNALSPATTPTPARTFSSAA